MYMEAERYCYHEGGKLVEPKNSAENDALTRITSSNQWLGVNDILVEGKWVYQSDRKTIKWANWNSNQPYNSSSNYDVAYLVGILAYCLKKN